MPDKLLFLMSKIQHVLVTHIKNELKKEGIVLSPGQIGIILALERDQKTTMGKLSKVIEIDNAASSRLADKLEKEQLVERYINPEDRRQVNIAITQKGLDTARIVKKVVQTANARIKEGFTDKEIKTYQRVNKAIFEKFR